MQFNAYKVSTLSSQFEDFLTIKTDSRYAKHETSALFTNERLYRVVHTSRPSFVSA